MMIDILKNYTFEFKKYEKGEHTFFIGAGTELFRDFEYEEIRKARIKVRCNAIVEENSVSIDMKLIGIVNVQCDVCGDFFNLKIKKHVFLNFRVANSPIEDEPELIYIPVDSVSIDLKKIVYDYSILSLPMKIVHQKNENGQRKCNPETLKLLDEFKQKSKGSNIKGLNDLKNKFNNNK